MSDVAQDTAPRQARTRAVPAFRRPMHDSAVQTVPGSVLGLQRLAGNRATAALLGGAAARADCGACPLRSSPSRQLIASEGRTVQRCGGPPENGAESSDEATGSDAPTTQRLRDSGDDEAHSQSPVQRDLWDDASSLASGALNTVGQAASGVVGAASKALSGQGGAAAPGVTASILPGGTGDWHEVAQALTIAIAGFDILGELPGLAKQAITAAGSVTAAGGDYGPQNALRHCIFAGLVTSHGWKQALLEIGVGVAVPGTLLLAVFGATMGARIRIILQAHEWFADDGCGNFGTGTVDSQCDQHNNSVGIGIGGPFTDDSTVIANATAALNSGQLWMTPGPTDLSKTVSTAGWPSSPWYVGGVAQQPDCSKVVKK
jgi:hypothetical protein